MKTPETRRTFIQYCLVATGIFATPSLWAAEKTKTVSRRNLKGTEGKYLLNSDKHKLIRIDSRGVKLSDIIIKSGNKSASLSSIIEKLEKKPAKDKEILLADTPNDFPRISKEEVKLVSELGDNESIVVSGTDYMYGCSWVGYFCYSY